MIRPIFFRVFLFLVMSTLLLISSVNGGAAQAVSGPQELSTEQLQAVVDLIQDPKKRESFLKDLKGIMASKGAIQKSAGKAEPSGDQKRDVLFIEGLFVRFESLSGKVMASGAGAFQAAERIPAGLKAFKDRLSRPEGRLKAMHLALDIIAGLVFSLFVFLLLRKSVSSLSRPSGTILAKVVLGFFRIILSLIPYGGLLVALFLLFRFFPTFYRARDLTLLFFWILFLYRGVVEVTRFLLAPDDDKSRILPLSGEGAYYLWIWLIRFAVYTAIYHFVVRVLPLLGVDASSVSFVRGLLLLLYPCILSVFVLQVAREIRGHFEKSANPGDGGKGQRARVYESCMKYGPMVAIGYFWAIFLFMVVRFEQGFRYLLAATVRTALVLAGLFIALRILAWLFNKFFAINEKVKERFPGLEAKTNRYILIFQTVVRWAAIILGLGVVAQVWGIPVAVFVSSKTGSLLLTRIIAIAITLGVMGAIIETSQLFKEYLLAAKRGGKKVTVTQKTQTLVPMIVAAVKIGTGFVGGIIILDQLGVNTTPILAGAGIVGLAVGFGSQTLVKDLINGLFILFEESVRVGDYAVLGKEEGMVEAVGLRTIKLRDVSGNVHVVPNSSIDTLTNMSKEFSRTVIDIGVAYREDVDEVTQILEGIGEEMRADSKWGEEILEPMELFGLQKFDDSAVVIRVRFTTKPLKQWGLKRAFNRRVKKRFDERGIEIPFPHRTVYQGEPKKGPAPPLQVNLQDKGGECENHTR